MAEKILITILIIFANTEVSISVAANCTDGCLSGDQRVSLISQLYQMFQEALRTLASCFTNGNQDANECLSNPCLNGGTCTDQINGYVCICACTIMCFTGLQCQTGFTVLILRNDVAGSNARAFNLPWTQYTQGFGNPATHYWIGLERLYQATQKTCRVRFDLQSLDGTWNNAQYSSFKVGNSSTNYMLTIGGFSGNSPDAMAYHNGQQFSTYDRDNDLWSGNCAQSFGGGFWFNFCVWADITTSPASYDFRWYDPKGDPYIQLSVVLVNLIC